MAASLAGWQLAKICSKVMDGLANLMQNILQYINIIFFPHLFAYALRRKKVVRKRINQKNLKIKRKENYSRSKSVCVYVSTYSDKRPSIVVL